MIEEKIGFKGLELNANALSKWHSIGSNVDVLVVDNVLSEPEALRDLAWTRKFATPSPREYYPGWLAVPNLDGEKQFLKSIAKFFLDRLWPNGWPQTLTLDHVEPHTKFAVFGLDRERAASSGYTDQHVDSHSWLATVTYLFDDTSQLDGLRGTAFWRHRPTGLQTFVSGDLLQTAYLEKFLGLQFFDQFREVAHGFPTLSAATASKMITEMRQDNRKLFSIDENDNWELVEYIPAKFNRLIAYPTWQFHSIVDTTQTDALSKDNARLTYNGFVSFPLTGKLCPQPKYSGGGYIHVKNMLISSDT